MSEQVRRCRICGLNEAKVSLGVWRGGSELSRTFVCASCAAREERLLGRGACRRSASGVVGFVAERQSRRAGSDPEKGCPVCGTTEAEVEADCLLGCAYCYVRYGSEVVRALRTAHGSVQHLGKSPMG